MFCFCDFPREVPFTNFFAYSLHAYTLLSIKSLTFKHRQGVNSNKVWTRLVIVFEKYKAQVVVFSSFFLFKLSLFLIQVSNWHTHLLLTLHCISVRDCTLQVKRERKLIQKSHKNIAWCCFSLFFLIFFFFWWHGSHRHQEWLERKVCGSLWPTVRRYVVQTDEPLRFGSFILKTWYILPAEHWLLLPKTKYIFIF